MAYLACLNNGPLVRCLGKALLELGEIGPVGVVHDGPVLVLPRVGSEVSAAKVLDVLLGVAHGRLNGGMAEELLDVAKVGPMCQKMGSAGVAEGVDGQAFTIKTSAVDELLKAARDACAGERRERGAPKERRVGRAGADEVEKVARGILGDWHDPVLGELRHANAEEPP